MNKGTKKAKGEPKSNRKAKAAKPANGSLFMLFAVIAAASALLVAMIYLVNRPEHIKVEYEDLPAEMLPRDVMEHPEFFHWFTSWKKIDGYLMVQEFSLVSEAEFNWSGLEATVKDDELEAVNSRRYVWAPDGKHYIDFLDGYGGEELRVSLGTAGERGELFRRGAPGGFHDAFWLDDGRFVVVGVRPELRGDGSRLCLSGEGAEKCLDRLTLDVVDVAVGRVKSFESEKHYFESNPYDNQNMKDWLESLTDIEKARAGVAEKMSYRDVSGEVESVDRSGTVGLLTEDGSQEFVMAERVQILDDKGQAAGLGFIRPGLKVKAVVIEADDGSWRVIQRITVEEVPDIMLYNPKEGSAVSVVNIVGAARKEVSELTIRVKNLRTGILMVDDVVSLRHEGGEWQDFGTAVDLIDDARSGDEIVVSVFDAANPDGGYEVKVEYSP